MTRVIVLLLAALLTAPASAQTPPPFDLRAALGRAASALFTISVTSTIEVTAARHIDRYADGFEYDVYEVRAGGKSAGRMTRIQVHPDARSVVDFAVRREGHRIAAIAELRPTVLRGKPFGALPRLFWALKGNDAGDYCRGMARLFGALGLAVKSQSGPPEIRPAPPGAEGPPLLSVKQPSLEIGAPMPAFQASDQDGKAVSPALFKGAPGAIFIGSLRDGMTRDMLDFAGPSLRARSAFKALLVLTDTPEQIALYRRYLRHPESTLYPFVADPDERLRKLFCAPIVPYLHLFDKQGKLAAKTFWRGVAPLEEELAKVEKGSK